jgi:hypothetical protein
MYFSNNYTDTLVRKTTAFLICLFTFAGCGSQQIEGESPDALYDSYSNLKSSLPQEKKEEFRKDVALVLNGAEISSLADGLEALGGALGSSEEGNMEEKVMTYYFKESDNLDLVRGKTPEEISSTADSIEIEDELSDVEDNLAKVKESVSSIRNKVEKGKTSRQALQNLEVESRISESDNRFSDHNVVEFRVTNGLDETIRIVEVSCEYINERESVTYAEGSMKFEFSSNVIPEERDSFTGRPSFSSEFRNVTLYKNAEMVCNPVKVWGPSSDDPIYRTTFDYSEGGISFSYDEKSLSQMKGYFKKKKSKLDSLTSRKDSLISIQ